MAKRKSIKRNRNVRKISLNSSNKNNYIDIEIIKSDKILNDKKEPLTIETTKNNEMHNDISLKIDITENTTDEEQIKENVRSHFLQLETYEKSNQQSEMADVFDQKYLCDISHNKQKSKDFDLVHENAKNKFLNNDFHICSKKEHIIEITKKANQKGIETNDSENIEKFKANDLFQLENDVKINSTNTLYTTESSRPARLTKYLSLKHFKDSSFYSKSQDFILNSRQNKFSNVKTKICNRNIECSLSQTDTQPKFFTKKDVIRPSYFKQSQSNTQKGFQNLSLNKKLESDINAHKNTVSSISLRARESFTENSYVKNIFQHDKFNVTVCKNIEKCEKTNSESNSLREKDDFFTSKNKQKTKNGGIETKNIRTCEKKRKEEELNLIESGFLEKYKKPTKINNASTEFKDCSRDLNSFFACTPKAPLEEELSLSVTHRSPVFKSIVKTPIKNFICADKHEQLTVKTPQAFDHYDENVKPSPISVSSYVLRHGLNNSKTKKSIVSGKYFPIVRKCPDYIERLKKERERLIDSLKISPYSEEHYEDIMIEDYRKMLNEIKKAYPRRNYKTNFEIVDDDTKLSNAKGSRRGVCVQIIRASRLYREYDFPDTYKIFLEKQADKIREICKGIEEVEKKLDEYYHINQKASTYIPNFVVTDSSSDFLNDVKEKEKIQKKIKPKKLVKGTYIYYCYKNLLKTGENDKLDEILKFLELCNDFKASYDENVYIYNHDIGFWVKSKNIAQPIIYFQTKARQISLEKHNEFFCKSKKKIYFHKNLIKATTFPAIRKMLEKYKETFRDDHFISQLNKEGSLMPCKNCILDLKTGITKPKTPSTNTFTFQLDLTYKTHTKSRRLDRFFKKLLPEKRDRQFLFYTLSRCLSYDTLHSKATWFVGTGSNGISVLINLFQEIMSHFCITKNHDLFKNNQIRSYNPSSIDDLFLKRVCVINENYFEIFPEDGFSRLTGIDKILIDRKSDNYDILHEVRTKFIFLSKILPNISDNNLILDKIRFLKFPTTFVENPQNENEKIIDYQILKKLKKSKHKNAFFTKLVKYFLKFHSKNPKFFDETKYILPQENKNTGFFSFLNEFTVYSQGWATTNEAIWQIYNHWCVKNNLDVLIKRIDIKEQFERYLKTSNYSKFYSENNISYSNTRFCCSHDQAIDKQSIFLKSDIVDKKRVKTESKTRRLWKNIWITYNY